MNADDPNYNPYDDENFTVTSQLGGKTTIITSAEFRRHNYNGTSDDELTGLFVETPYERVDEPGQYRVAKLIIPCGGIFPSKDGKTKDVVGPKSVGSISRQSGLAKWLSALKDARFPMKELGIKAMAGLVGAKIEWKAVPPAKGSKSDRAKDFPGGFHGFATEAELAAALSWVEAAKSGQAPAEAEQTAAAPAIEQIDEGALKVKLATAVAELVTEVGEVKRAQLAIKVTGKIKDFTPGERSKALAMLLRDEFLADIPGVEYNKVTLKKAA